jgi:hypothetical protein
LQAHIHNNKLKRPFGVFLQHAKSENRHIRQRENMTKEQYAEMLKDIGETHKNGKYIA